MNSKAVGTLAVAVLALIGYLVWYLVSSKPSERQALVNAQFRAEYMRPVTLSAKSDQFSIQFDGQDALAQVVKVESGRNVKVVARFPPLSSHGDFCDQSMEIVPRLESQGDDAFQWSDPETERHVSWSGYLPADPYQERPPSESIRFKLRPGNYRVRYYLQLHPQDLEMGLSEKHFLAESRVIVTGDPSAGVIPLADPMNLIRAESE